MVDGRQLADFSLVDQPTIGLRQAVAASKAEVGRFHGESRLRGRCVL
jgi:hypothetical protein